MATQRHLRAMNRALKATGADRDPIYAPFVELARDLARQMDSCAGSASTRNLAAYRAVLKELGRIGPQAAPTANASNVTPPAEMDRLRAFRETHLRGD